MFKHLTFLASQNNFSDILKAGDFIQFFKANTLMHSTFMKQSFNAIFEETVHSNLQQTHT